MSDNFEVRSVVTVKEVSDLFVTAIDGGGSDYWCRNIEYQGSFREKKEPWYADEASFNEDFKAIVRYNDSEGGNARKTITRADIDKGLNILAREFPSHWGDFLQDRADAETADAFLQCVVLGDVIYG